jgi:hypothetical protein
MSKLLLFIGENEQFDKDEVVEKITSIGGITNARKGSFIGAVFECEYQVSGLSTIVRLSDDLETITVDGMDDDSLNFVLKLKEVLSQPISVVDMDYSFHIKLSDVSTLDEFKQKIREGV